MSFLELAQKRVSVRGYQTDLISDDQINQVLEAGRLAPSAANRQPVHFIVVKDEKKRHELTDPRRKDWFWQAPVIIVVCTEPAKAWARADGKNYADVDASIALDHMTLCAADLGLGTCWVAAFDRSRVKQALNLPDGIEPLAMTPLGIPTDKGAPKKRKSLSEMIHYDRWNGKNGSEP